VPQQPVLALCSALCLWAALALPLVRVAPNRLLSGQPVYLADLLPHGGWLTLALLPVLTMLALVAWPWLRARSRQPPPLRQAVDPPPWLTPLLLLTMSLTLAGLLWLAGGHASLIAQTESRLARTSLGAGFWSLLALIWLMCQDALSHSQRSDAWRAALLALVAAPSMVMIWLGCGDDLSIMKEYANRSDAFWQALLRHLQIVSVATLPSVLLGLPLAWGCSRSGALQRLLFPLLNIIQTIPSIALFGLFMAPLAWAATRYPALAQAGISGVGMAPAVLALLLYSLLPIVRSALAGLQQVPAAATTAARAMGLSGWQIFYQIEVPLALPVLLPGLRTAVVQTIGLAAVTALVGAGGLGALMFDGLFSAANELVLLGVLPIVLLAMLADALFKGLTALAGHGTASAAANGAVR